MDKDKQEQLIKSFNTLVNASRDFRGTAADHELIRNSADVLGLFLKEYLEKQQEKPQDTK